MVTAIEFAGTQLFVHTQEPHTHEVTGQGMAAQIKAHTDLLEGITPRRSSAAPGRHTPRRRSSQGQCGVEALEVTIRMLGGEVLGSLGRAGPELRVRAQTQSGQTGEKKTGQPSQWMQNRCLLMLCPPLARRTAPVPTLKSFVILAFVNKAT